MIFALRKVPKYLRWFRRKIKVTSLGWDMESGKTSGKEGGVCKAKKKF